MKVLKQLKEMIISGYGVSQLKKYGNAKKLVIGLNGVFIASRNDK
jgi:hypothetical protein